MFLETGVLIPACLITGMFLYSVFPCNRYVLIFGIILSSVLITGKFLETGVLITDRFL